MSGDDPGHDRSFQSSGIGIVRIYGNVGRKERGSFCKVDLITEFRA